MDHYVTTYKRDYTWPQMSCAFSPPQVAALKVAVPKVAAPKVAAPKVAAPKVAAPKVAKTTACNCVDSRKSLEKLLRMCWEACDKNSTDRTDQSLKLYLIKGEDKPKTPAVKCPDPCDEKLARVDTDRLKTTYQVDYRDPGAARSTQRDKSPATSERDCQPLRCYLPVRITIQPDFQSLCHLHLLRNCKNSRTEIPALEKRKIPESHPRRKTPKGGKVYPDKAGPLRPWKSEYQDMSQLGRDIIEAKLLHPKKSVLSVYVTSN